MTFTELRVADEVAATLVTREQLLSLDGWVLAHALPSGTLIALDALRSPSAPEELRAMSLPLPEDRAVAGAVQAGDRIDIIEVRDDAAVYIATGVEVLAVGGGASGPLAGTAGFSLTIAVNDVTALVLARAVEGSAVHVLRSTGSATARVGEGVGPRQPRPWADGVEAESTGPESDSAGGG